MEKNWTLKDTAALSAVLLLALLVRLPAGVPSAVGGDAANYIKLAWSMRYASSADVVIGTMYSFGYSIFIWLGSYICNDLDKAALWVSVFFGVLSIVPLFLLGRLLFGTPVALVACIAFAFFPPHITVSQTIESDSTYIFWALVSVYLLIRGFIRPKPLYYYGLVGALFGFTYIIRPEIQITLAALAVVGIYMLWTKHAARPYRLVLVMMLLVISFFTVNLPKLIWMHKTTGYWMLDGRKNFTIAALNTYQSNWKQHDSRSQINLAHEKVLFGLSSKGELNIMERRSFINWFLQDPKLRFKYYWANFISSINNIDLRMAMVLLLALLSVILASRQERHKLLFLYITFTPVVIILFFYSIGRGSYFGRSGPAVAFAPILLILSAYGLILTAKRFGRKVLYTILALSLVIWCWTGITQWNLYRGWHKEIPVDAYLMVDRMNGEKINNMLPKDTKVMCRSWGLSRYINHESIMIPYATYPEVIEYARKKGVDYLIAGLQTEWLRPDLEFLAPDQFKEGKIPYEKNIEFYGICESAKEEGEGYYKCDLAIYKIKKYKSNVNK